MGADRPRYGDGVLGGAAADERRRLAAMAAVCDPTTIRALEQIGVAGGWRCLEVGAGGGSIAAWLAARVADPADPADGIVVATDLDTGPLRALVSEHLTVLEHDVTADPAPGSAPFDLIHARFVLEHLPEREDVLDRLVTWLAPGGTLLIESIAGFPVASSSRPAFRAAMEGIDRALGATIGTDTTWARTFPAPLFSRNLADVGAAIHLPSTGGGNASALCWELTLRRLRPQIDALGVAAADVEEALRLLRDPTFFDFAFATALAWGRRPA